MPYLRLILLIDSIITILGLLTCTYLGVAFWQSQNPICFPIVFLAGYETRRFRRLLRML